MASEQKDWTKSTLGERVLYAIKRAKLTDNLAEFARRAGLKNRVTLHRYTKSDQFAAERRLATALVAIAKVGNVSDRWLATGHGSPDDVPSAAPPQEERYPTKIPAAEAMRGLVDEEAIRAMLSEEHRGSSEDPGEQFWMKRAMWWHMERAQIRHQMKTDGGSLEEPPPLAPRPKTERGKRKP